MDEKSVNIRKAEPAEASVLAGVIRESFRDVAARFNLTPQNCPKHPSNCTDDWVRNDFQRGVAYYILEHEGAPAGCVALERADAEVCYMERLAVLPQCRRRGLGRALVDYVLSQAKSGGAKRMGIGIIAKQTDLKSWYQKIGFMEKETKEFVHLPFMVSFMEYNFSF